MRRLLAFVLLAFTFLACQLNATWPTAHEYTQHPRDKALALADTVPVYIDVKFAPDHRAALHDAIDQWNVALNGNLLLVVVSDTFDMDLDVIQRVFLTEQGLLILARSATEEVVVQVLPEGCLGWTPGAPSNEVNIVDDRVGTRDLPSIAMHEIGHALGLQHVPIPGSLMFPRYRESAPCIDDATIRQLARVRGWSREHMNWCSYSYTGRVLPLEFPFDDYVDLTIVPGQAWGYQVQGLAVDLSGCALTLSCPDLALTVTGTVSVTNAGLSDVRSNIAFRVASTSTASLLPGTYDYRISALFGSNPPTPFSAGDSVPFGRGTILVLAALS